MAPIRNRGELCSHGDAEARALLVDVVDGALDAVHPDRLVPGHLTRWDGTLCVDGRAYDLDSTDRVLVVGAGKGSLALVRAVGDALGDRLSGGVVVEKRGGADGEGAIRENAPDGVEVL
jgi:glycerate-2-kinase